MESCLKLGEKYPHGLGALLYKMGKISTLSQATTQNTTTTHNNQHEQARPTHQRLRSSLSMAKSVMGLDLGATAPYGSEAGAGR